MNAYQTLTNCLLAAILSSSAWASTLFDRFVDPHPAAGNQFGASVVPLSTGNVVITAPADASNGAYTGAVYLFNGATGALISELHGSTPGDSIGAGVTALANGNFVVRSPNWRNGGLSSAGAVTWVNGNTGINGTVSLANSLVGSKANDYVGNTEVIALSNGNYLVQSTSWDNGSIANAGAVTWGNGANGTIGAVNASNSLVGGSTNDYVGQDGVTLLGNGNYVVTSQSWDNGAATDAGAATWGSGTSGVSGVVSASNSLVGSYSNDRIGYIVVLANNNYLVRGSYWKNGSGAVVWGNGLSGVSGEVSAANGLVGKQGDRVSSYSAHPLPNGNYVILSHLWNNGTILSAGAVTWGNGTTGTTGIVSSSNSLVGTNATDGVGYTITILSNGNYVIHSPGWNYNRGAVTWCNGATGKVASVSSSNSLVGGNLSDRVGGEGVTELTNGDYVVISKDWDNGAVDKAGAVTLCNGSVGTTGLVSSANSLIGTATGDQVGSGYVRALTNGNFVVASPLWNNGAITDAGAVTWVSHSSGTSGTVSSANSLVGGTALDKVGSVLALTNGNYVVFSSLWNNGATADVGAVTWADGTTGITGLVSPANSLIGGQAGDNIGGGGMLALPGGNYLVRSPSWDNGSAANSGAVTWGNGLAGTVGPVSPSNSLVGSSSGDAVGLIRGLPNGNYLVLSSLWDNGAAVDAGAVTWGDGTSGVSGVVSASNSLVGSQSGDGVGGGQTEHLPNGNYLIGTANWDNGPLGNAGAVTWGDGTTGSSGVISSANSMIGGAANSGLSSISGYVYDYLSGTYKLLALDEVNGTFFGRFLTEGGGEVRVGSQDSGFALSPLISNPTVSAINTSGATLGGTITSDNGSSITARGVVCSPTLLNGNPRINGSGVLVFTHATNSTGTFTVQAIGLIADTVYSFSAFATNSAGTSYTLPTAAFTTLSPPGSGEIAVEQSPGSGLTSGISATDFGLVAVGSPASRSFLVKNLGTGTLGAIAASLSGGNAGDFAIGTEAATSVPNGGNTTLVITFTPSVTGNRATTLNIASNDADENPFVISLTGSADTPIAIADSVIAAANLTGPAAALDAIPFNDGVENLLKYAFNMNLAGPDTSGLTPGSGTSGLPSITTTGTGESGVLCVEFVQRVGSGLVYKPKKSASLDLGSFVPLSDTPTITPIGTDGLWERVTYDEPINLNTTPTCFSVVEVKLP